ncbi:MAG: flavodoxin [Coriobacteriia bacterium]
MNAVVVYESLWGNTAAVARAIAEGIGDGAQALPVDGVTDVMVAEADLIVAGAPLLGFALPTEGMRKSIAGDAKHKGHPPDMSHPSMRSWIERVPRGTAAIAGFETRIWWSPGSSAKKIAGMLQEAGYRQVAAPERFLVTGTYGPLKDGELERAKAWGQTLARAAGQA